MFFFAFFLKGKNFVPHGQASYFFSDTKATWGSANSQCNQLGGHLVSIHSKDEQDFITAQLKERYSSYFFHDNVTFYTKFM